jgi:putative membrane protein
MRGLLIRLLITAGALWVAARIVPGMSITGAGTMLAAAFLLGVVNAFVRPVVVVLTLPLTVLTLGLFLVVVNAAMLGLVAALLDGFVLRGFWSAVLGALFVGLFSWLGSAFIGDRGRYEVIVVRRRHG